MPLPDWAYEFFSLQKELGRWVSECIARQRHLPWRGGHDEGNFTNPMCGYYMLTGDEKVLEFLHELRDKFLEWRKKNFYHGYYPHDDIDVSHGIENFYGFLTNLLSAEPDDKKSLAAVEDVVHHLGNWVEGIPEWYDWKNHRLRSNYLGTRSVKDYPPYDYNCTAQSPVFDTALTTYILTHKSRYLDLAKDWGDMWCHIVEESKDAIPVFLYSEKDPEKAKQIYGDVYHPFGGVAGGGSWQEFACGIIYYLLRLGLVCNERNYIDSARKILDWFIDWKRSFWDVIGDPNMLMWVYKCASDDKHYDKILSAWAADLPMGNLPTIMMMELQTKELYWKNYWTKVYAYRAADGSVQEAGPRPVNLLAAYDISHRPELLSQSMRMARHVMIPARVTLRDGRDHGCSTLVYAHGAAQEVAYVLWPIAFGRQPFYRLRYYHNGHAVGLPPGIAVFCEMPMKNEQSITFYNDNEKEETLTVKSTLGGKEETLTIKPKATITVKIPTGEKLEGNLMLFGPHIPGG